MYLNGMLAMLLMGIIYDSTSYFEAALLIACSAAWAPRPWPSSCCAGR
jgi:NO-binding membrane sensor protein with MHYT domain